MSSTVEPMSCETALDLIEPLLDDELAASDAEDLRRHLDGCPSCSKEAAAARGVLAELRSLPELAPPPRVVKSAQRTIERESAYRHHRSGVAFRPVWLAAAAAVVLAVGTIGMIRHQTVTANAEARRAAAEVTYALACVSNITQRANRAIKNEVIDQRVVPMTTRGLARPFQRLSNGISQGGSPATSPEIRNEGNS
jgi:anti-sigma factor RsiW